MQQRRHPLSKAVEQTLGDEFQNSGLLSQRKGSQIFHRGASKPRLPDLLLPDQLGHLRTAFSLLDKDEDGIVGVTDLQYHFHVR